MTAPARPGFLPVTLPLLAVFLLATLLVCGCASDPTQGYSTRSTFPRDVQTVAVKIFRNETYTGQLQFGLADALVKTIESSTPYRVGTVMNADTELSGTITSVQLDQLSKSRTTGLAEEEMVVVTVDFEWRDLRTGRALVERRGFRVDALFVPSAPSYEPIEVGMYAATQALADAIVAELRSNW